MTSKELGSEAQKQVFTSAERSSSTAAANERRRAEHANRLVKANTDEVNLLLEEVLDDPFYPAPDLLNTLPDVPGSQIGLIKTQVLVADALAVQVAQALLATDTTDISTALSYPRIVASL